MAIVIDNTMVLTENILLDNFYNLEGQKEVCLSFPNYFITHNTEVLKFLQINQYYDIKIYISEDYIYLFLEYSNRITKYKLQSLTFNQNDTYFGAVFFVKIPDNFQVAQNIDHNGTVYFISEKHAIIKIRIYP